MGSNSYILSGTAARHAAVLRLGLPWGGTPVRRKQAVKRFTPRKVLEEMAGLGIAVRAHDFRGLSEEAPGAYKNIEAVVENRLPRRPGRKKTVRVRPLACIKG
jgi:tRNA-splicing ligase RtcB